MSVKLQRRTASVLGITGWCCERGWLCHRCVTHVSAGLCNPCGRAFLLLWSPGSPRCAQAKHPQVLAAGTWGFSGQCCLERRALTVSSADQSFDFKMIAEFIASPLFTVPGAVTFGALLCCAKGSGLPSLWRAHPAAVAPTGVSPAASPAVPHRGVCGGWGIG